MAKSTSADDVKLEESFQAVRKTLLENGKADRLAKRLGYWVLPNDRRLPIAFLNRTLNDLLNTPYQELISTPGIGQKKISSLVKLLLRATLDEPPAVPVGMVDLAGELQDLPDKPQPNKRFDPAIVSEALWAEWCRMVEHYGVSGETLGRLAPSLRRLPTVIWHTPMSEYLGHSLSEIRRLRTHGEKRVRCVLEVFHSVYQRLRNASASDNVQRLLAPKNIVAVQDWVASTIASPITPTANEIRDSFTLPILDQLQIDSGETVYRLCVERLGVNGEPMSVRDQSRLLGVTRARIYQLLDDCTKVMQVRWPEGKMQFDQLTSALSQRTDDSQSLSLFYGVRELCYPEKSRSPQTETGRTFFTHTAEDSIPQPHVAPPSQQPRLENSQPPGLRFDRPSGGPPSSHF
ncbi:MAG: hypothetical protein KDB27_29845 [Planctomycetales bacterium]|nr:hypothetical protein [Planctomycetales bacterium]